MSAPSAADPSPIDFSGRVAVVAIADRVVDEIERAGGVATASYDSVAAPEGGEGMVTETVPDNDYLERSGFLNAIRPELVVPLVVFLASPACHFSHRSYSACAGRFARGSASRRSPLRDSLHGPRPAPAPR